MKIIYTALVLYFVPGDVKFLGFHLTPFRIILVIASVRLFMHLSTKYRDPGEVQYSVVLSLLPVILSYFWSLAPHVTLGRSMDLFFLMLVYILTSQYLTSPVKLRQSSNFMVFFSVYAIFIGIVLSVIYGGYGIRPNEMQRIIDPNLLGQVYAANALFLVITLAYSWNNNKDLLYKLILCMIAMANFIFLLLTFSRSAIVAFSLMIMIFCFAFVKAYRHDKFAFLFRWLYLLSVASLVLYVVFTLVPSGILPIIDRISAIPLTSNQFVETGRYHIWTVAIEVLKEHPITGIGYGSFKAVFLPRIVHSDYLEIAVGAGIITLALFAGCILHSMIKFQRTRNYLKRKHPGVESMFTGFFYAMLILLFTAVFNPSILVNPFFFFFMSIISKGAKWATC